MLLSLAPYLARHLQSVFRSAFLSARIYGFWLPAYATVFGFSRPDYGFLASGCLFPSLSSSSSRFFSMSLSNFTYTAARSPPPFSFGNYCAAGYFCYLVSRNALLLASSFENLLSFRVFLALTFVFLVATWLPVCAPCIYVVHTLAFSIVPFDNVPSSRGVSAHIFCPASRHFVFRPYFLLCSVPLTLLLLRRHPRLFSTFLSVS